VAKNGFKQLINAIKEKDPEIVKPYQKYLKSL